VSNKTPTYSLKEILICPMCEEGQLIPNVCTEQTLYKGKTLTVDYEYSTCSTCGSEIVTPIQAHSNQARILDEQNPRLANQS